MQSKKKKYAPEHDKLDKILFDPWYDFDSEEEIAVLADASDISESLHDKPELEGPRPPFEAIVKQQLLGY